MQYIFLVMLFILMPHGSHADCPCKGKKPKPPAVEKHESAIKIV
jgi:hypothetical protein